MFPKEVEEILKLHPDVEDAMVVGGPDEQCGQAVTAVVELRPGGMFDEAACRAHVRRHLAACKTPKRVFAVGKLFRMPNGKSDYQPAREAAMAAGIWRVKKASSSFLKKRTKRLLSVTRKSRVALLDSLPEVPDKGFLLLFFKKEVPLHERI